jgi:hypothetical protein
VRTWQRGRSAGLVRLEDAARSLQPVAQRYLGLRTIPVDHIVGTASRDGDFDRAFRPRRRDLRKRRDAVEAAFPTGQFPAIVVRKLGDAYFVVDGHHRVAVARELGMAFVDADVTELVARWRLSPSADAAELLHAEQERLFAQESGLASARPDVRLRVTLPIGYRELLEAVQLHGYELVRSTGRALDAAAVAADWYDRVYRPSVHRILRDGLALACRNGTESDRYLYIAHQERRGLLDGGAGGPALGAV